MAVTVENMRRFAAATNLVLEGAPLRHQRMVAALANIGIHSINDVDKVLRSMERSVNDLTISASERLREGGSMYGS